MINVMVHKANEELQLILRMHKQRHHVVCCSFSSFYSLTHSLTLSSFFLLLLRSQSMLWCTTHSNQKYHQVAFWRSFMLQTKYTIASVLMYICKSLGIYMRQKSFLFFLLLLLFGLENENMLEPSTLTACSVPLSSSSSLLRGEEEERSSWQPKLSMDSFHARCCWAGRDTWCCRFPSHQHHSWSCSPCWCLLSRLRSWTPRFHFFLATWTCSLLSRWRSLWQWLPFSSAQAQTARMRSRQASAGHPPPCSSTCLATRSP